MKKEHRPTCCRSQRQPKAVCIDISDIGDEDIESASIVEGIDLSIQQRVNTIGMVIFSRDRTRAVYPLGQINQPSVGFKDCLRLYVKA